MPYRKGFGTIFLITVRMSVSNFVVQVRSVDNGCAEGHGDGECQPLKHILGIHLHSFWSGFTLLVLMLGEKEPHALDYL